MTTKEKIITLICAFTIIVFFVWRPFSDGNTIYVQWHYKNCTDNSCKWRNDTKYVFYVNEESETVKLWSSAHKQFRRYKDSCVVVDKDNWSCSKFEMKGLNEGELIKAHSDYSGYGENRKYREVSYIRWWLTKDE